MTDPSPNLDSPLNASLPGAQPASSSRGKGVTIAGLLSFFLPNMGQLFNRRPRKALGIVIITHIFGAVVAHTCLLLGFWTMVATILVLIGWQLFVAAEAARSTASARKPELPVPLAWATYPVLMVIIIISALAPSPAHRMPQSGFQTYKIPSASMCPTICVGDRIVANARAYHSTPPQRGDIILLKHPSSDAFFVKRVIGLPADLVEPGRTAPSS